MEFSARDIALERGERLLYTKLGFSARSGALLRLSGPNGSGKTSLIRVLTGFLKPNAGEVLLNGVSIARLQEDFYRHLVYVGHKNALSESLTAIENLETASNLLGISADRRLLMEALERIGLAFFADDPCGTLSQGQRRRVSLARLFLTQSKPIWILDEPFSALDVASLDALSEAVASHVKTGGIVLYTTHQDVPIDVPTEASRTLDVSVFAPKTRRSHA